ncbi:MAG: ABC transporter permease [Peptococcaceae bacterium]|nr:ABC transporter permease [Peptococcaceae bacterium]
MEQKYRWLLVRRNLRAKRRTWLKNMLLMLVACVLILVTGGLAYSIDLFMTDYLLGAPWLRDLRVDAFIEDKDRVLEALNGLAEENSHIKDIFEQNPGATCEVADAEKYGKMGFDMSDPWYGYIVPESDGYLDDRYLSGGRWIERGERNVGLLPEYFTMNLTGDMQDWNTRLTYVDGEKLIGERISLRYYTYRIMGDELVKDREFTYEFDVIGTYHNLKAGQDSGTVIFPDDDIREMTENVERNTEGITKDLGVHYHVMVDAVENMESVKQQLLEIARDISNARVTPVGGPGSLEILSDLLKSVGIVIGIALFVIEGLILATTFYHQIHDRTKEIGVYKAVGYRNHHIISIVSGEIMAAGIITFALSVMISGGFMLCLSMILKWKATLLLTQIQFALSGSHLLLGLVLSATVMVLGSAGGLIQALRLEAKEALVVRRK